MADSGRVATVYNLEVEGDHTYFVGCDEWGFSVWAHNTDACNYNMLKHRLRVEEGRNAGYSRTQPLLHGDEARVRYFESLDILAAHRLQQQAAHEAALSRALVSPYDPLTPGRPAPGRSIDSRQLANAADATSTGFPRDNIASWEIWIAQHPEHLSSANQALIQGVNPRTGASQAPRSPRIDDQWLQHFPEHAAYRWDDLWLHHAQWRNPATGLIENGPYLQPVPRPTHLGQEAHWHGNLDVVNPQPH